MKAASGFDTDVLVIGAGPAGATAALALATYGVRCRVVSRWNWLADTPRAHITNQRTMEVLRDLGLEPQVMRAATPWELMGDTLFTTSMAGQELLRLRTWGTGEQRRSDYLSASPCGMADIIQPLLEPILLGQAAERGAALAFNTEYVSHRQDADGVVAELRDRSDDRAYSLRARYLIGADGANSQVARDLGLRIEGRMARAGTAYVLFDADLSRYAAHRPSILYWIVNGHAGFGEIGMGLLRAVRPWTRWIAGWGFDLAAGEPDLSEEAVRPMIAALIGDPAVPIDVVRSSIWYVNQAFATEYGVGRVFCAGDSVHRHPPSSGLGLNTCVQDSFNLAWKLAFVLNGFAGEKLLSSYSLERAPVGRQVVLRANQSRLDYAPLRACLRIDEADDPVAAGVSRLRDPGPDGVDVRARIMAALELKNTEFNAQGVEMNQRYESAAIVQDVGTGPEIWARDRELHLQATTRPGAKLPHAWLVNRLGRRVSTLDLVGRGLFSVVTGLAGGVWRDAVVDLGLPCVRGVTIGDDDAQDVYLDWQRLREIHEAGALLVRPDGIVAWRQMAPAADRGAAVRALRSALETILDLSPSGMDAMAHRRQPPVGVCSSPTESLR